MTEANTGNRQLAGVAVLVLAIVVAFGVGASLMFSGGGPIADTPESAVRAMYDAINKGDRKAFEEVLAPDVIEEGQAQLVPFPASVGVYEGFDGKEAAKVSGLRLRVIGEQENWALVGISGTLEFKGEERPFNETAYLQRVGDSWKVSTQQLFLGRPDTGTTVDGDLGPLVPDRPDIGKPAPDFALIDARDGTTVRKLSDFRGTPVVVNWYASWCGPCKEEIPEFQQAQDTLGDSVVFFGVNVREDAERATSILDEFGATYPAVLDRDGRVSDHYRANALPHTVFIDAEGIVRAIKVGQVHADDLEENLAKIGLEYSAS